MLISLKYVQLQKSDIEAFQKQLLFETAPRGCVHRMLYGSLDSTQHLLLDCWVNTACLREHHSPKAKTCHSSLDVYDTKAAAPVYPKAFLTIHQIWLERLPFALETPQNALAQYILEPVKQHQPLGILTFWRTQATMQAVHSLYLQAFAGIEVGLETFKPSILVGKRLKLLSATTQALAAD